LLKIRLLALLAGVSTVLLFAGGADLPRKAPELAFTVPGQGDKLLSQYRGKVIALEFILTTCPHCQAASHLMSQLQQEYGSRGFQALDVAINGVDEGRTPAQANELVQAFATNNQTNFPVGWTPREQMLSFTGFSVMNRFVVPQLILIDRKGIIHYQTPPLGDPNAMQESTIRQRVEELLGSGATAAKHSASATRMGTAKKAS
jgi:thiol-disulfide isomerase/thioredoxin